MTHRRQAAGPARGRRQGRSWVTIAAFLIAVYVCSLLISQQVQIQAMSARGDDLRDEMTALEMKLGQLVETRELLSSDEYVGMMAREQLGLVKEGEIPYTVTERQD